MVGPTVLWVYSIMRLQNHECTVLHTYSTVLAVYSTISIQYYECTVLSIMSVYYQYTVLWMCSITSVHYYTSVQFY